MCKQESQGIGSFNLILLQGRGGKIRGGSMANCEEYIQAQARQLTRFANAFDYDAPSNAFAHARAGRFPGSGHTSQSSRRQRWRH